MILLLKTYILKTADGNDSYDGLCILGPGVGSGGDGYYFEVSSNRGIYFIIDGTSVSQGIHGLMTVSGTMLLLDQVVLFIFS